MNFSKFLVFSYEFCNYFQKYKNTLSNLKKYPTLSEKCLLKLRKKHIFINCPILASSTSDVSQAGSEHLIWAALGQSPHKQQQHQVKHQVKAPSPTNNPGLRLLSAFWPICQKYNITLLLNIISFRDSFKHNYAERN